MSELNRALGGNHTPIYIGGKMRMMAPITVGMLKELEQYCLRLAVNNFFANIKGLDIPKDIINTQLSQINRSAETAVNGTVGIIHLLYLRLKHEGATPEEIDSISAVEVMEHVEDIQDDGLGVDEEAQKKILELRQRIAELKSEAIETGPAHGSAPSS